MRNKCVYALRIDVLLDVLLESGLLQMTLSIEVEVSSL
jgi:hypothetical protein